MAMPFKTGLGLILWLFVGLVRSANVLSVWLQYPTINTATRVFMTFDVHSSTAYTESSFQLLFPSYLGMTYASTIPSLCTEMAGQVTSAYNNRSPSCLFSTDSSDNIVLTVTNLDTSVNVNRYSIQVDGLTTGPSAIGTTFGDKISITTYESSTQVDSADAQSDLYFSFVSKTSGVTLTGNPAQNNAVGELEVVFSLAQPIPAAGSFSIGLPKQDSQYKGLISSVKTSMVPDEGDITVRATIKTGSSSQSLGTLSATVEQESDITFIKFLLGNSAEIAVGKVLYIVITGILMPPSFAPLTGFQIFTGDTDYHKIEVATYPTLTNTEPGDDDSIGFTSSIAILTDTAISAKDSNYQFTIYVSGDLPVGSYFTLLVPDDVTIPNGSVSELTFVCQYYCDDSSVSLSWSSSSRLLTVQQIFPSLATYVRGSGPLVFEIKGFTNPATNTAAYFEWSSYVVLNSKAYLVDNISNIYIQAATGSCTVLELYPSDGNYMIYGVASSWYFKVTCKNEILTDYGVRVTFPDDWYVITTSSCEMGGHGADFVCSALNSDGTITVYNFLKNRLAANAQWSFTLDSVRNPGLMEKAYTITVQTLSSSGGSIDSGSFEIEDDVIVKGEIWEFSVTPQNYGVGMYPVMYDFVIQPSGEIYAGAYLVITLPTEVEIYSERQLEKNCTLPTNFYGFTNPTLSCKLANDQIFVYSGFVDRATTNMTIDDKMVTPRLRFTLPQFLNPRTIEVTEAFGLSIYSKEREEIYTWTKTYAPTKNGQAITDGSITEGPTIELSLAATPQKVTIDPVSAINGAVTDFTLTITTTNSLIEGDQIKIQLPKPVYFTQSSGCQGISDNLRPEQTSEVSEDLTEMTITLLLPQYRRRLQSIGAGQTFSILLTDVQNPQSTRPTIGSLVYSSYTNNFLIETQSSGLIITNEEPGLFENQFLQIKPQSFLKSALTNYTLSFRPKNYEQNMQIELGLPKQIRLGDRENVNCYGDQGTDGFNLKCSLDLVARTITVQNAVTFQSSNPGLIKIIFETFQNPDNNILTDPFVLTTRTSDGYLLDKDNTTLTIDFFCQFPCASCSPFDKTLCYSCYIQDASYQFWFDYQCLQVCPSGFIGTDKSNCTQCTHPCATCSKDSSTCDSCVNGYRKRLGTSTCVKRVYWPFPFLVMAVLSFFVIGISEFHTKSESRFKEAFVAALSIPEVLSWITFLIWHAVEYGFLGSFALGLVALLLYGLINLMHACIHKCRLMPKAPKTYQTLRKRYSISTFFFRHISYWVSFKFSLILVSYLCLSARFKGDYSNLNWKQFHRFSLAWVLFCYPIMMLAAVYFLITETLFSYTGFLALEVILISTLGMGILLLDAISACKCRVLPNRQIQPQKSANQDQATAALYESEDESSSKRILKKRRNKEMDEFGRADEQSRLGEEESNASFMRQDHQQQQLINQERKRHLRMLEELARQMRQEKEELRLERERIERERYLLEHGEDHEYFGSIIQREETVTFRKQANQKQRSQEQYQVEMQAIHQQQRSEEQYQEESETEEEFMQQRAIRKDYHNIEAEMRADYGEEEPSHHSQGEGDQNQQSGLQLPLVLPRAGGDSVECPSDKEEAEGYVDLGSRQSAVFSNIDKNHSASLNESYLDRGSAQNDREMDQSLSRLSDEADQNKEGTLHDKDASKSPVNRSMVKKGIVKGGDADEKLAKSYKKQNGQVTPSETSSQNEKEEGDPTKPLNKKHRKKAVEGQDENQAADQVSVDRSDQDNHDRLSAAESLEKKVRQGENKQLEEGDYVEYNPKNTQQVEEDSGSGFSQSSEGIVDHHPFAQALQKVKFRNPTIKGKDGPHHQALIPAAQDRRNQPIAQSQALPARQKRPIIYSDKSESSIDEMMGDTPSNYNLANGRVDGVSKGLKAIFHQQMVSGKKLATKLEQISPAQPQKNEQRESIETNDLNFVNQPILQPELADKSGSAWRDINQSLNQHSRSREYVVEQSSTDEQQFIRKKHKAIKTNKVFSENHDSVRALVSPPRYPPEEQDQEHSSAESAVQEVRKNNFV